MKSRIAAMLASAASNQIGAAAGAHAFGAVGVPGVVAIRQLVTAVVLLPVARPDPRRMTWSQWWPALLLALVFAVMNLSLYEAVSRIGLGLAVTLEVLGPLAVGLAASRSRADLLCAIAAGAGVYVLVRPGPSSDLIGTGAALLAAGCWAAYILVNRTAGKRLPGLQPVAVASSLSALLYLPVLAVLLAHGRLGGAALGYAVTAGVLSSAIPYAIDLVALRHVPARFFGLFMSVHPVLATVAGAVLLGQHPVAHEWAGMALVIAANAAGARNGRPESPSPTPRPAVAAPARRPARSR
jgi:inner membrane transporter RhtA